jgi:putative peptidoglycan lipid II flippase
VNALLLVVFMRRRLGRLEGGRLSSTILRICVASVAMAIAAWFVSASALTLPLHGTALQLVRVVGSMTMAAVVFYLACRTLRIEELSEAVDAIAGRFLRLLRRQ